jgi:hypothetical protein
MKRTLLFIILGALLVNESDAQFTRYLVKLRNKGGGPYTLANPLAYLSQRSIDRRVRYGIALDSTDLPCTPSYITQIRNVPNVTILNVSKWLNQVSIQTTDPNAITTINGFPFVQSVSGLAAKMIEDNTPVIPRNKFELEEAVTPLVNTERPGGINGDYFNYGTSSYNEIHLHNGEFLHNIGLRGQGMQVAVIDNGFNNYLTMRAFDSVRINGQILGTWDFVAREQNVSNDGSHGMQCFSTISANIPGVFIGKAPKANFWLFQTEDNASEFPIEEHNWACGAERSDSSGADIISTSLGYNTFDAPATGLNHTYNDMNGNTTMAAIAADLAAKKGLLVFAANGNEGTNAWHYLITPADGDSVIAVGAVTAAGVIGNFSSYGPSSDGQIKPDVASVGVSALVASGNSVATSNGTSFACPNMAGLGTCLWQGFPEANNMKIALALKASGSIAMTPNDRIGYGIPNVKYAFAGLLVDYATSNASINACNVTLNWTTKDVRAMRFEIERKTVTDAGYVKIADVTSQNGDILAIHSYQYINNLVNVANGTVSYRVRQVLDTAAASFLAVYIDTASVTASGCTATGVVNPDPNKDFVTLVPNPATTQATLVIETKYAVPDMPIAIFDMKGRLLLRMRQSKGAGQVNIDLPIQKLPAGKYIIKVYNKQKAIGTTEMIRL